MVESRTMRSHRQPRKIRASVCDYFFVANTCTSIFFYAYSDAARTRYYTPLLTPSPSTGAHRMSEKGYFPLPDIVTVDPDLFKAAFPEWPEYLRHCPDKAGSLTRRESGYLVEIAQEVSCEKKSN